MQFSWSGWRYNALRQLKSGDRVVLVSTMGDQTPEDMEGRVLGVTEPSCVPVVSIDFAVRARPDDFVDGEDKWPAGLTNLYAWSRSERPKLTQISDRKFRMDSAQRMVPLAEDEAVRILAMEWSTEALSQPTVEAPARMAKTHEEVRFRSFYRPAPEIKVFLIKEALHK